MDWSIYVILGFIFSKIFPIYAILVLMVVTVTIIWYIVGNCIDREMSKMEVKHDIKSDRLLGQRGKEKIQSSSGS